MMISPLTIHSVAAGPDQLSLSLLHHLPDLPQLLLRLEADEVHAPGLAPVLGSEPISQSRIFLRLTGVDVAVVVALVMIVVIVVVVMEGPVRLPGLAELEVPDSCLEKSD